MVIVKIDAQLFMTLCINSNNADNNDDITLPEGTHKRSDTTIQDHWIPRVFGCLGCRADRAMPPGLEPDLDDATPENGCMHVIPGGHLHGGVKHHHGTDCEIAPDLLETGRAEAVPIPAGGALFFYGMLPHETPPNRSPHRRRALQFHFRGAGTRIIDEEAYDRVFVDCTGAPASCRAASRLGF